MATNKKENTAPEAIENETPEAIENETPETVAENTDPNRRVEIFIPRGQANDEPNLLVSVNGKNFLLPKGKTSTVPAYIADEIKRSWRAQERWNDRSHAMIEQTKAPVA